MDLIKQLLKKTPYQYFVKFENKKILLENVASYKKIEVILSLTELLDDINIEYVMDEEFNLQICN